MKIKIFSIVLAIIMTASLVIGCAGRKEPPIEQEEVTVENDGNCGALAESLYGSLKDVNDAVVLILGTEIGGGNRFGTDS